MSLVAAFVLAAATAQAAPVDAAPPRGEGPVLESARVSVTILRPVVLKDGRLGSSGTADRPRSQRRAAQGRITYEFE